MTNNRPNPRKHTPLRMIRSEAHLPINKGDSGTGIHSVLPQIRGRSTIAALWFAQGTAKGLLGNIRPMRKPGRAERFRALLIDHLGSTPVVKEIRDHLGTDVRVDVFEAFGKPSLVSFDLVLLDPEDRLTGVRELYFARKAGKQIDSTDGEGTETPGTVEHDLSPEERGSLAVLTADLMERAVRVLWDNPEMAPVAVRGRIIAVHSTEYGKDLPHTRGKLTLERNESLLLDLTDLGYMDEIARVEDLYLKYGPPASDPLWKP